MPTAQHDFEWQTLLESTPYPAEAYEFVQGGLTYTQERIYEQESQLAAEERHIRGQEFCLGLRDLAIDRWGLMAPAVLRNWNIHRTLDFGRIVFAMIDAGLMSKTDEDSLDDFRGVYEFDEAFSRDALLTGIGAV
ncbi:MAG: hypothetical protein MK082_04585 [Phycisphaerales bacterium]|nr:hypothetical protein [Phycisphaerales bacterium]